MKNKCFLLLILFPLIASSCSLIPSISNSSSSTSGDSASSSSTSSISKEDIEISFTAINDFHGAINETDDQPGLAKLASYLKEKKEQGNILINAGDMWQGTFESNYNRGKLVTEAFSDIGFDAEILGNHEFDWGIDKIKENQSINKSKYLCANIMQYNESGNPSYVGDKYELGNDYNIITVNKDSDKEIKVGLIGVIGKDQLTSIESRKSEGIIFYEPTNIVKELAIKLRNEENCDVVGAIYHASLIDDVDSSLSNYVDIFWGAHTHKVESTFINGKPYAQAGCNGVYASNITLSVNKSTHTVKYKGTQSKNSFDDIGVVEKISHTIGEDTNIKKMIDEYAYESTAVANKEVGTITSSFKKGKVSNALAKGMYEITKKKYNKDIVLAITNTARNAINKTGTIYYSDLVTAVPFDNEIVIMDAKGYNINDELSYNYYYGENIPEFESNKYYTIAVCSYVAYHINVNSNYERYLNYFATQKNVYELTDENNNKVYYRDGLEYLFQTATNNTLNPNDF